MTKKTIFLLLGQKGSGKSFIGTLMEKEFQIHFLRVEKWAKAVKRDRAIDSLSPYAKRRIIKENNNEPGCPMFVYFLLSV